MEGFGAALDRTGGLLRIVDATNAARGDLNAGEHFRGAISSADGGETLSRCVMGRLLSGYPLIKIFVSIHSKGV